MENTLINNSYSTGSVSGDENVGGFVGKHNSRGVILNSYSTGDVSGSVKDIGGFVGQMTDDKVIISSFSTGEVSGNDDNRGGFAGDLNFGSLIQDVYWYWSGVGEELCFGQGILGGGSCTQELDETFFFDNSNVPMNTWNFTNIWKISSGEYPKLQWEA